MSNNHFWPGWTLKAHRRLKNVVCAMEWQPPPTRRSAAASNSNPDGMSLGATPTLSAEQAARVRAAFGFFDSASDGRLTASELAALGRAVDLHTVAAIPSAASSSLDDVGGRRVGALRLSEPESPVVPLVEEQLFSHQEGPGTRHWIVLSLPEAESLRGALHISQENGEGLLSPGYAGQGVVPLVALHTHSEMLDAVNYSRQPTSDYERDDVRECLSFLSSHTEFDTRAQHLLLRCLQATSLGSARPSSTRCTPAAAAVRPRGTRRPPRQCSASPTSLRSSSTARCSRP